MCVDLLHDQFCFFHVIEDRKKLPDDFRSLIHTLKDNGWEVEDIGTGYWGAFCWTSQFKAAMGDLSLSIQETRVYAKSFGSIRVK